MEAPLNIIIADDESLARDTVRLLLEDVKDVEVVAEASDGRQAVDAIREYEPDLVFLDIVMPGKGGFDLLEQVEDKDFEVIFT
ncbi:MAG: LytR/AlgR family response regulator transcription factor, partial [Rhodothermales bacterium]